MLDPNRFTGACRTLALAVVALEARIGELEGSSSSDGPELVEEPEVEELSLQELEEAWELETPPEEYLERYAERYPDSDNVELARVLVAARQG